VVAGPLTSDVLPSLDVDEVDRLLTGEFIWSSTPPDLSPSTVIAADDGLAVDFSLRSIG